MKSFQATIFVGFRFGYSEKSYSLEDCKKILRLYCDSEGFCVSVTETVFIYKDGEENGAIIGIIQYPRFYEEESSLKDRTIKIANLLMEGLEQKRVSINFPDEVIMLTNEK